jgi:hypothetical protein
MSEPIAIPQVHLLDPEGQITAVDPSEAQSLAMIGYTPASPQQIADYQNAQARSAYYGSPTMQFMTGAKSAASALTLGATDWLSRLGARAVGGPAAEAREVEQSRSMEEENPAAAGIGSALGVGLGLAAQAPFSAPGMASRAGRAVQAAAEAAMPAAGGVGSRIAARAAQVGLGSAVEGSFYGLGQDVHEAALGDHDLTAQSLMAHGALGALIGGSFGAPLGALEAGIPAAIKGAQDAVSGALQKFKAAYPQVAETLTGAPAGQVRQALFESAPVAFRTQEEIWALQKDMGQSLEDVANQVGSARRKLYSMARPAETSDLLASAGVTDDAARAAAQRVSDTMRGRVAQMLEDRDSYSPGMAKAMGEIADGLERRSSDGDARAIFQDIWDTRKKLDDLAFPSGPLSGKPFAEQKAILAARDLRSTVRGAITDDSVWGPAAARQAAIDSAESDYQRSLELLTKGKKGPLNANLFRTFRSGGQETLELNQRALGTALNQMADPRGQPVAEAFQQFLQSAKDYTQEMDQSFRFAPTAEFDRESLLNLVNKASDLTAKARQQASATQIINSLPGSGAGFGAGGAKALTPIVGKSGAAEGVGLAAMAPLLEHVTPGLGVPAAILGSAKAAYGAFQTVKNVPQMIAILTRLERTIQSVNGSIDAGVSTLARAGSAASAIGRGEVVAGLESAFGKSAAESASEFRRRAADLQRLSQNSTEMNDRLNRQVDGWYEHAPKTAAALGATSARTVAFLASKLPQSQKPGLLAPAPPPSQADIATFNRYYNAAKHPLSILRHAAAGTLTSEEVETVATCFPQLHAKIATKALEAAALHPDMPYRNRVMLAKLVGHDVDGSTTPSSLALNQAVRGQQAPAPPPSSKGIEHMSKGTMAMTGAQALASPGEEA